MEWNEKVKRHRAWNAAIDYHYENDAHEFPTDADLEKCITSGRIDKMTDHCWEILKAQYPQEDIE